MDFYWYQFLCQVSQVYTLTWLTDHNISALYSSEKPTLDQTYNKAMTSLREICIKPCPTKIVQSHQGQSQASFDQCVRQNRASEITLFFQDCTSKLACDAFLSGESSAKKAEQNSMLLDYLHREPYPMNVVAQIKASTSDPRGFSKFCIGNKNEGGNRMIDNFINTVNQILNRTFYVSYLHLGLVLGISQKQKLTTVFDRLGKQSNFPEYIRSQYLFPLDNEERKFGVLNEILRFSYQEYENHYANENNTLIEQTINKFYKTSDLSDKVFLVVLMKLKSGSKVNTVKPHMYVLRYLQKEQVFYASKKSTHTHLGDKSKSRGKNVIKSFYDYFSFKASVKPPLTQANTVNKPTSVEKVSKKKPQNSKGEVNSQS